MAAMILRPRPSRATLLWLLAGVFAPAPALAQPVYKSVMPDGSVVYSEKPASGARRADKIDVTPPASGIGGLTPEEKQRAEQLARERAASSAGDMQTRSHVAEAEKRLQAALAAQAAGKEPLPTERLGIVGGGTRLTEAYFERQKALEAAVAAARKSLEQARAGGR